MKLINNKFLLAFYIFIVIKQIISIKKNKQKFIIKDATKEDINELFELHKEIFKSDRPKVFFENRLKEKYGRSYIMINSNNKIIGYIILSYDRHQFYIDSIGLDEKYRHHNLGEKLMKYAIKNILNEFSYCINNKKLYFSLHVLTTNMPAIDLYKKMNFKIHKFLPKLYINNDEIDENKSDGYYMIYIPIDSKNKDCEIELFDYEYWKLG